MTPKTPLAVAATLALGLMATLPAAAQERDDRFTLRLGVMHADAQGEFRGATRVLGQDISFAEDFDFGSKELVPRIDGVLRLSQRNRLLFDYFKYDKTQRTVLGSDLSYDDVTLPAGSYAEAEVEFQLASLLYDFAVVDGPTWNLGLQLGAQGAELKGTVLAEAGEDSYRSSAGETGYAPTVGLRLTATPSEHWRFNLQAQHLEASWGDFDNYDGSISRANALVEYRFTRNLGVHAGYDWFKLDVEQTGSEGLLGLDQRFRGPVAGLTLAF